MICPKCGKELGEGVINCRDCNPPPSANGTVVVGEAPKSTNVCAVIGFILACISLLPGITLVISSASVPFVIPAFVLCIIGLRNAKKLNSGRSLAVWGIVISVISLIVAIVVNVILPLLGVIVSVILSVLTALIGVVGTAAQLGLMQTLLENLDETQIQSLTDVLLILEELVYIFGI